MANFKNFENRPLHGGIQYKTFYPNGYGVSIVQHDFSYGGRSGRWELAVLKGTKDDWNICYTTDITDDVLGYLTESNVDEICNKVEKL